MKYLWIIFAIAAAMRGLNLAYDYASGRTGPGGSEKRLEELRQTCESEMMKARRGFDFARQTCDCMIEKGKAFRERQPDADYTRELHMRYAKQCVEWG